MHRWINRQKNINNVYNDGQNVHNTNIQQSFRKSVENLLNDPIKSLNLDEILLDNIITKLVKEQIIEYCNDETVHSVLDITFKELFTLVWERIKSSRYKNNIKQILNEELMDASCKCFTGRMTRLVNVLNGYYDDIIISISESEQIGSIISIMIGEGKIKEEIEIELLGRGISKEIINEWLQYV